MNRIGQSARRATALSCCIAVMSWVGLLGCGPEELIINSRVDRWCGERPCGWETEGSIERVGSWHSHDYAVSFASDGAVLSQTNLNVSSQNAACFEFEMLADVEARVGLFLELDFLVDEHVDFSQRMPESHWEPLHFLVTPPVWYDGVRFLLRKEGRGRAVLGQLRAFVGDACRAPPVELVERPRGAPCEEDNQCRSDTCFDSVCTECDTDDDCEEGQLCGLTTGFYDYASGCVDEGSSELGERCDRDAQCDSGICCDGVCSQCCDDDACPDGQSCDRSGGLVDASLDGELALLWQCEPGTGQVPSDGWCSADADCESGSCAGSEWVCDVGRCAAPDDCQEGSCTHRHLSGGRCE